MLNFFNSPALAKETVEKKSDLWYIGFQSSVISGQLKDFC